MRHRSVLSHDLHVNGRRLDARPHVGGGVEAKRIVARLTLPLERLASLTVEGVNGIFIAPYFKRVYVEDREHGIPLLGNTHILLSDPSLDAPLLSKRVFRDYGEKLSLKRGWILVTCFGTVGNLSYVREDMEECAGSTNFMRIVADESLIPSGYLYAYLRSEVGHALLTVGETGSVIPNLLPSHVVDLQVPRLGAQTENEVDEMVKRAASLRSEATRLEREAVARVQSELRRNAGDAEEIGA